MILVAGATGTLGSEICRLLAKKGRELRALVRESSDPGRVKELESLGAGIVRGDLKEKASLDGACSGVETVISTVSSTLSRGDGDGIESVDRDGQLNLVRAAEEAGVGHFILISFPEMAEASPLQDAKRSAEDALKKSEMKYTVLQPALFSEVWLSPALGFDAANGTARIYGNGQEKISWISYKDVARFAVEAVDNRAAVDQVIELGGPEALSPLEVVKMFEGVTGKKFDVEHIPVEALRAQKAAAEDSMQQTFAGLMLSYAAGQPINMTETLRKFPIELVSVERYARSFANA